MKKFGSAVILCGGKSRRMGFDKCKITFDGKRMYEYIAEKLEGIFDEIILVTSKEVLVEHTKYKVVTDIIEGCGSMGGIYTGLAHTVSEFVFFTACDMPYVDENLIKEEMKALEEGLYQGVIVANGEFVEPLHSFYSKELINPIMRSIASGDYQINKLVQLSNIRILPESYWNKGENTKLFNNLNHFKDIDELDKDCRDKIGFDQVDSKKISGVKIKRYVKDSSEILNDIVIIEQLLHIYVNGKHYGTLTYTPGDETAFVMGFLFSQGLIREKNEVLSIEFRDLNIAMVLLEKSALNVYSEIFAQTSGCGGGKVRLGLFEEEKLKRVTGCISVDRACIYKNMGSFMKMSPLFKETGGVHSCAVYFNETMLFHKEDIGRHNAIDKIIGDMLIKGISFNDKLLFTTGRVSSDIMLKAIRAEIPVVVSHSAPTSMAVELAEKTGVTLIGFVRGDRMNIYSGHNRIL